MKRIIIIACFSLLVFSVKAQSLTGTWVLDNVQVKNKSTSVIQTLSQSESTSSIARWPTKLEISEDGMCSCTFHNGSHLGPSFKIDGSRITMSYADKAIEYSWLIDEQTNTLQLIYTDTSMSELEQIARYHR